MELSNINVISSSQILSQSFFQRPAELVAPDLIGCMLIKNSTDKNYLCGVIVETEAYSQEEASCHGKNRRSKSNETLFGEPGKLYVYLTYGIYYCVNVVTDKKNWASGVLLRAIAIPGEHERIASGPGLLANRFNFNRHHDGMKISSKNGVLIASRSMEVNMQKMVRTTRIGISQAKDLSWRWYLQGSRSVSKRAKGDRCPQMKNAWTPSQGYRP